MPEARGRRERSPAVYWPRMLPRRMFSAILALALAVALLPAGGAAAPRARSLTILYFNDIHGHLEPWKPDDGGATVLSQVLADQL